MGIRVKRYLGAHSAFSDKQRSSFNPASGKAFCSQLAEHKIQVMYTAALFYSQKCPTNMLNFYRNFENEIFNSPRVS